jgi:hypothetical protein
MRFTAKVRREGKDGRVVAIPIKIVRALARHGWDRTWIEITVGNHTWIAKARPGGASTIVALPRMYGGWDYEPGQRIDANVVDPGPRRCNPGPLFSSGGDLDWSAALPDDCFAEQDCHALVLHTKYAAPFRMRRMQPRDAFWILGAYQAEGSKGKTANDWSIANKSPAFIRKVGEQLALCGIDASRFWLEIIHDKTQNPDDACAPYRDLGIDIRRTQVRSDKGFKGSEAAVIHMRESKCLLRMYRAALKEIVDGDGIDRMSAEQAREFAIGYLDGDGCVVWSTKGTANIIQLRFSGRYNERHAALRAVKKGFEWKRKRTKAQDRSARDGGMILSLTTNEALDMLLTDAFVDSFSRVRLLQGVVHRTRNIGMTDYPDEVERKLREVRDEIALFKKKRPSLKLGRQRKGTLNPLR